MENMDFLPLASFSHTRLTRPIAENIKEDCSGSREKITCVLCLPLASQKRFEFL